jgi:hypothetical protein
MATVLLTLAQRIVSSRFTRCRFSRRRNWSGQMEEHLSLRSFDRREHEKSNSSAVWESSDKMTAIKKTAILSDCGAYRYRLGRIWNPSLEAAVFILLNPSTADDKEDDRTINKCVKFATLWGCGSIEVVNLFAFRTKKPHEMKKAMEPVGIDNERHIRDAVAAATGAIVCAWGNHGSHRDQDLIVLGWLRELNVKALCLRMTNRGCPEHPLYIPYETPLISYMGRTATAR